MVVNRYANRLLRIYNCMPQHYNHTMYYYNTLHYKRYIYIYIHIHTYTVYLYLRCLTE